MPFFHCLGSFCIFFLLFSMKCIIEMFFYMYPSDTDRFALKKKTAIGKNIHRLAVIHFNCSISLCSLQYVFFVSYHIGLLLCLYLLV